MTVMMHTIKSIFIFDFGKLSVKIKAKNKDFHRGKPLINKRDP